MGKKTFCPNHYFMICIVTSLLLMNDGIYIKSSNRNSLHSVLYKSVVMFKSNISEANVTVATILYRQLEVTSIDVDCKVLCIESEGPLADAKKKTEENEVCFLS